jgi:hypothetical protein
MAEISVVDPDPDPMDLHHFGSLDPHQMKLRIRIKLISWIRNRIRINLQMPSQNLWNNEPILALFQRFDPLFRS